MMIEKIAERSYHAQDFLAHNPGTDAHGQFRVGGVIKGPVKAILGEAGPEVVVPMKKKFMNKKVKDVVRYFKRKEMGKSAARFLTKKKKPRRHGGYEEKKDGTLVSLSFLGSRQSLSPGAGFGAEMGSLHSGGWHEGATVRGGSTPSLR